MNESYEDALENTLVVSSLLAFLIDNAPITQKQIAELLRKYSSDPQFKRRPPEDLNRISKAREIVYAKDAIVWINAIDSLLYNLKESDLVPLKAHAKNNGILLKTKSIAEIDPKLLSSYRAKKEQELGVQRYLHPERTQRITPEQANDLSGAWRMFRIAGETQIFTNIMFFHAEPGAYRARRFLFTSEGHWSGETVISQEGQLISYFASPSGGFACSIHTLPNRRLNRLATSGFAMIQSTPADSTISIRTDLVFGYRLHQRNVSDDAGNTISTDLGEFCALSAPEKERSIAAALRVIRGQTVTKDQQDLIAAGFRVTRLFSEMDFKSLKDCIDKLSEIKELENLAEHIEVNDLSIPAFGVPSIVGKFRWQSSDLGKVR